MSVLVAYPPLLETAVSIQENEIPVLIIENRKAYRDFLIALQNQQAGRDDSIIFSEDGKDLKSSQVGYIEDVVNIDLNSKTLLTHLLSRLETQVQQEEYLQDLQEVAIGSQQLLLRLSEDSPIEFDFSDVFDIKAWLKSSNIVLNLGTESYLESLVKYLMLSRELLKTRIFVLVNLHLYLDENDLQEFYKMLHYNKIPALLLEGIETPKLNLEKHYIIDTDLCSIY